MQDNGKLGAKEWFQLKPLLKGSVINSASTDDLISPVYFQADLDIEKEATVKIFMWNFQMFEILKSPRSAVCECCLCVPSWWLIDYICSKVYSRANDLKLIYNTQRAVYLIFPLMMRKLGMDANGLREDLNFV